MVLYGLTSRRRAVVGSFRARRATGGGRVPRQAMAQAAAVPSQPNGFSVHSGRTLKKPHWVL